MKIKTSELIGQALAWAVTVADGNEQLFWSNWEGEGYPETDDGPYRPDLNWEQGGLIIEREKIELDPFMDGERAWRASKYVACVGPTPLIAAMRCYIALKLGDEVEIPEELT